MARVVAVVADLMLGTKVEETLRAAGHQVALVGAVDDAPLEGAELVVADLGEIDPGRLAGRGAPVLGFYPHTETEVRERAEAAGVELAVPRSRMARELPELAERLLAER